MCIYLYIHIDIHIHIHVQVHTHIYILINQKITELNAEKQIHNHVCKLNEHIRQKKVQHVKDEMSITNVFT